MRTFAKVALALLWLGWTTAVFIFHYGTLTPPLITPPQMAGSAKWFPRTSEQQIQNLVLEGEPYARGLKGGEFTRDLLFRQETELLDMFVKLFPARPLIYAFELAVIPYFKGVEDAIPSEFLLEMYGISRSADRLFDRYADGFTRQLAYHGLHEVGQMMVDRRGDDRFAMACTALAVPFGKTWVVGRNFDFEGGKTLDEDKLLKWVFPAKGYAFVSVIWAGMVGGVTAVNEKGLYLSLNAANTDSFNRLGQPSTILLINTVEHAATADEAIAILRDTPAMISDLFLLVDSQAGKAYRIEKSPVHTAVIELSGPSALTNHMIDPFWQNDPVNRFRRDDLTSDYRRARAEQLLAGFQVKNPKDIDQALLRLLRDKKDLDGAPLPLGDRRAIDALVANHGVIFNGATQTLYVSRGPHLVQGFEGYDLTASFQKHAPVRTTLLPADEDLTPEQFHDYTHYQFILDVAEKDLRSSSHENFLRAVKDAEAMIAKDPRLADARFYDLQARFAQSLNDKTQTQTYAQKALDLKPAYKIDERRLKELAK